MLNANTLYSVVVDLKDKNIQLNRTTYEPIKYYIHKADSRDWPTRSSPHTAHRSNVPKVKNNENTNKTEGAGGPIVPVNPHQLPVLKRGELKRRNRRLKTFGLAYGQELWVAPRDFSLYPAAKTTMGIASCTYFKDEDISVLIHNISSKQWDELENKIALCCNVLDNRGPYTLLATLNLEKSSKAWSEFVDSLEDDDDESAFIPGPKPFEFITLKVYNELTKRGCAYCSANIAVSDADSLEWTQDNQPICEPCQDKLIAQA